MVLRKVVAILLAILPIFLFAVEPIKVVRSEKEIVVLTRFEEYHFDLEKGILKDFYTLVDGRKHVFTYGNDGFDVLDEGTPLTVIEEPIVTGVGKVSEGFSDEVSIVYNYGYVKKIFTIKNNENYTFFVDIESSKPVDVTVPRVSVDTSTDRYLENYFASFNPKTRTLVLLKHDEGLLFEGTLKVNGQKRFIVFMGPNKRTLIKKAFPEDYDVLIKALVNIPGFNKWYDSVFYGLVWFFWWLKDLTKNFGWAIMLFTLIVRLILYPLYHAQTKSLINMRKLQPQIEAIKKKYKDPTKQQEALLKLYREAGVNPASGCLMLLIQLPIFMLLWSVIRYYVEEFAYSGSFLIWKDLSAGGFSNNWLFLVITIVASYYTTLLTSQDARTAWQGIIMSVIFPFLFVGLPSGLFLYYATNTLIQLAVTYYTYKRYKIKGLTTRELLGLPKKA
ncbi:membrane protein insertase YidC [Thermotoga maritima MSB8]|uniref:Membrane protein insertase YidC n=1 Tax=Thermotoga maritima (strain ATCC 43589 / DSM 3109 / JCM 10099 / NBRC 100826 / MSB8) TaxID=243274 RepID=YIDC_THEMA|nr:membrane protein insertase YidC [Thermotoga maritima]Q9X1H2.1 RecName: Full=Membrane protein insertase YidC; AltName: Full=Foldase YidC; AltName: Full=Membrane integrase YidC; AltName: Full=Membrane protein YidC [Thermotoga maritima MSB8]AAD36529.1 inner membrane protein, putative [Thermotoga maritima MSB8]AGL50391.1 Inner membrane protein translocase component YidC, long form [Thermotoga maritima MSB8]AHD18646.1 membrane protein insertase YidC [Thermotoga maritima MSB8]